MRREADGRKRVEGQIKESEEKVGKKRNEVSSIALCHGSPAEECGDERYGHKAWLTSS